MKRGKGREGVVLLCAALLLSLSACGGRRAALREVPPPPPTGPKVALAPLENRSNVIDAAEIVRAAFREEILRRGWNVMPAEESDRILREELGISYGGQLASTTPGEVCRALGVEGVFYGEVAEWNKTTTGIYNKVTVTASFELFGKDGASLWKESDTQSKVDVPRGGRDIGAEIVVHALGNLLLNPMTPYGKAVGKTIAGRLPPGLLEGRESGDAGRPEAGAMQDNTISGPTGPDEKGGTR